MTKYKCPAMIWAITLVCAALFGESVKAQSPTGKAFTVRDAIEMQHFDTQSFAGRGESAHEWMQFSPDRQRVALVTQKGLLASNELESTIWVFDVEALQ